MILDIIISVALIASTVIGIVRGFVKEISVIVGLILGFYIASQKYVMLEKYLFKSVPPSTTYKIITFIIILVIVFFLVFLLGLLLQKLVQLIMLGWLDKILGGIFGFIKGLIIIWLILMLILAIFPKAQNPISNSKLAIRIIEFGTKLNKLPIKVSRPKKLLTQSTNLLILIVGHQQISISCD